jgi:hypothetical protein
MKTGLLIAAALFAATPALAQGTAAERAACKPDAVKFCLLHALVGDREGVIKCLVANKKKISKPCRDALAAHNL